MYKNFPVVRKSSGPREADWGAQMGIVVVLGSFLSPTILQILQNWKTFECTYAFIISLGVPPIAVIVSLGVIQRGKKDK